MNDTPPRSGVRGAPHAALRLGRCLPSPLPRTIPKSARADRGAGMWLRPRAGISHIKENPLSRNSYDDLLLYPAFTQVLSDKGFRAAIPPASPQGYRCSADRSGRYEGLVPPRPCTRSDAGAQARSIGLPFGAPLSRAEDGLWKAKP